MASSRHDGRRGGGGGGYDREERGVSILYQYEIQTGSRDGGWALRVCVCVRLGFAFPFGHQGDRTTAPAPSPLMKRASPRK